MPSSNSAGELSTRNRRLPIKCCMKSVGSILITIRRGQSWDLSRPAKYGREVVRRSRLASRESPFAITGFPLENTGEFAVRTSQS